MRRTEFRKADLKQFKNQNSSKEHRTIPIKVVWRSLGVSMQRAFGFTRCSFSLHTSSTEEESLQRDCLKGQTERC